MRTEDSLFCNEEDLKNKVILPYLEDLGFYPSEIKFEKSFTIRLGKNKHVVKRKDSELRGRLDILCRKGNKNLFLIEVKAQNEVLDQDDIDQGISYARLLDNIPPFVVVTNGSKSRVVDSITKKVLDGTKLKEQSEFWQNGCTLSADDDVRIRHLALKHFVSMSDVNLTSYCSRQISDRMNILAGEADNRDAKYNPTTYVRRIELETEFRKFLDSNYHVFAILGESGVGKTSSLCHLCFETSKKEFVFFYNAALMGHPLLETIATDLNLFFSGTTHEEKVLTTLRDFAVSRGKKVIVFIDAIDESPMQNFRYELSELALNLKHNGNIKICISCKANLWQLFLSINGQQSYLSPEVYGQAIMSTGSEQAPGFLLTRYNDRELSEALKNYRRLYGLKGKFAPVLKADLRHAFFLKVFSQVNSGKTIPNHINDKKLLENYIQQKLDKIAPEKRGKILKILIVTARLMLEKDSNQRSDDGAVTAAEVIKASQLHPLDDLPSELFTSYLFIKTNDLIDQRISVYFSKIRDYLLIEHAYKMGRLSPKDLEKTLPDFFNGNVGFSAIHFFSEICTVQHSLILQKYTKYKVSEYLFVYSEFLDRNFYNTKESFDPYTKGSIGILVPQDTGSLQGGYALFPKEPGENVNPIVELPMIPIFGDDSVFNKYHARKVHGSYLDLIRNDTRHSVLQNIREQLTSIINEMTLDESNSPTLEIEKVTHIVYYYRKELGYCKVEDRFLPRLVEVFPIDLNEVKDRLYQFFAVEYYKNEYLKKQIASGVIPLKNNSITYSPSDFDWNEIYANVERAIKEKEFIVPLSIHGDYPPFVYLDGCVDRLLARGITQLSAPQLPQPDVKIKDIPRAIANRNGRDNWIPDILIAQFSDEQIKNYVDSFFRIVEQAYIEIVDSCFPILKSDFPFHKTLPYTYYVHLILDNPRAWSLSYGYSNSLTGKTEIVFVDEDLWTEGQRKYGLTSWHYLSLDKLFEERHSAKMMVRGFNTRQVDERLVIRKWVYEVLTNDINVWCKKAGV